MNLKAESSITSMILLIASLLMCILLVTMYYQSAFATTGKASASGLATRTMLSTVVVPMVITGLYGDEGINEIMLVVAPSDTVTPFQLRDLFITAATWNTTTNYFYGEEKTLIYDGREGTYTVSYLERGSGNVEGTLRKGDLVQINILLPRSLKHSENVKLKVFITGGLPLNKEFKTPLKNGADSALLYP